MASPEYGYDNSLGEPYAGEFSDEVSSVGLPDERPIDRLKPGSELHARVLDWLLKRLEDSEREMSKFYSRWQVLEKQMQAYISLPEWERRLKELNDQGRPPKMVSIVIPYTFATVSTVVTYHVQVFTGRKPFNTVTTYKEEFVQAARNHEQLIQYNCDHNRYVRHLWQAVQDAQTYGVGVFLNQWAVDKKLRTKIRTTPQVDLFGNPLSPVVERTRELTTIYEGNRTSTLDPFMFFPDPRVPMQEVNRRGEYVLWRSYDGHHILKRDEYDGLLKWVDAAGDVLPENKFGGGSARGIVSQGEAHPGTDVRTCAGKSYKQIDQGTCVIIPKELGLGDDTRPQKWLFTIANKKQIIQADVFDADHDMHPVAVTEPYTVGYGFGQLGLTDYMAPLEAGLGWLFNTHMDNVRRMLNDILVVDPSMVVIKDVKKNMGPGGIIRLKRSAFGQDVRQAIMQLPIVDMTQQHLKDMEVLFRIGRHISAVDENLMGLQDSGGRKTATEVRVGVEAGASRLAAQARLISSQCIVDLVEQMSLNLQQYLSPDFYMEILGADGQKHPINLGNTVGDFNYPTHDGTLPIDRTAMVDLWREILVGAAQDPQLRQSYSIPKIFEYIAELAGAQNIEQFRIQAGSEESIEQELTAGNMVPVDELAGNLPGVVPDPARRLQGAL